MSPGALHSGAATPAPNILGFKGSMPCRGARTRPAWLPRGLWFTLCPPLSTLRSHLTCRAAPLPTSPISAAFFDSFQPIPAAVPAAIQVRLLDSLKPSLLIPKGKGVVAITALFYQITVLANLFYLRDELTTKGSSRSPFPRWVLLRERGAPLTYRHWGLGGSARSGGERGRAAGPRRAGAMWLRSRVAEGPGDARPRPHPITPMRRR